MAARPVNILSLCSGAFDGLALGVELALPAARCICYVEREAFCCASLVHAMEAGGSEGRGMLAEAPVWTDIGTFDGRPWRGCVDLIVAGLPCQPYSVAGKRRGHDDERAIWPEFIRIVDECRPAVVFLENVPAFAQWFRRPGEALCRLGYEIEDPLFLAASDVGATHQRKRLFLLAYRDPGGLPRPCGQLSTDGDAQPGHDAGDGIEALADAECARWPAAGPRPREHAAPESEARSGGHLPLFPPGPDDLDAWREVLDAASGGGPTLAPALPGDRLALLSRARRLYRLVAPGINRRARGRISREAFEPAIRRLADGTADRVDWLRALGNGVVPLQAAHAFRLLCARARNRKRS